MTIDPTQLPLYPWEFRLMNDAFPNTLDDEIDTDEHESDELRSGSMAGPRWYAKG